VICKMNLCLKYAGGGEYNKLLTYEGDSQEEIASSIQRDENELLHYMTTEDDKGSKAFVFQGFMFKKAGIETAHFTEPDF